MWHQDQEASWQFDSVCSFREWSDCFETNLWPVLCGIQTGQPTTERSNWWDDNSFNICVTAQVLLKDAQACLTVKWYHTWPSKSQWLFMIWLLKQHQQPRWDMWSVCHCLDPTTLYRARTEYESEFNYFWKNEPPGKKETKENTY